MKTLLIVAAALATSGALALAETPVPDGLAANLKEKYSETRLFPYLSEGGVKFEIFMSPATGRVILEEAGRGV
jgi:hypothetical protein